MGEMGAWWNVQCMMNPGTMSRKLLFEKKQEDSQ